MKTYRIIFVIYYLFSLVPLFFFSMVLGSDFPIWDKVQALAVVAFHGALGTVFLHILGKKEKFSETFFAACAFIDFLMLATAVFAVMRTLEQSRIVIRDLITCYAVMLAFLSGFGCGIFSISTTISVKIQTYSRHWIIRCQISDKGRQDSRPLSDCL